MKLRWALKIGEQSLLTQVFNRKYGRCGNINEEVMLSPIDSAFWKSIVSLWPKFQDYKFWGVGNGANILFGDAKWLDSTWRLCDVNTNEGGWNLDMIRNVLPNNIIQHISYSSS